MTSSENSLNYLIGNFVDETVVANANPNLPQNNMISIDTSNGYLGFNTIDPMYHIDVCNGTIQSGNLILNNLFNSDNSGSLPANSIYRTHSGTLKIK